MTGFGWCVMHPTWTALDHQTLGVGPSSNFFHCFSSVDLRLRPGLVDQTQHGLPKPLGLRQGL